MLQNVTDLILEPGEMDISLLLMKISGVYGNNGLINVYHNPLVLFTVVRVENQTFYG